MTSAALDETLIENSGTVNLEDNPPRLNTGRLIALVFLVSTAFGLLAAFQMYANTADERAMFPFSRVFQLTVVNSWLKALVTIPLVKILERIPLSRATWKRRIGMYVILLPLFVLAHVSIRPFMVPFVMYNSPNATTHYSYADRVKIGFRSFFLDDAWGFSCIVLALHAWQYGQIVRIRTLNQERLQARLARAELQLLKMQLQPHFLFNTLNTIYNLAPRNSQKAQQMIARLSELLRLSLDHVSNQTVTLQRELEFLNSYLEIEKTRFEERLMLVWDVDPETLDAEVPNMILQPLVENSLRHGIGKKAAGGSIKISARKSQSRLVIFITDDGKGFDSTKATASRGIGLSNTRARLTQLYGSDFYFELVPGNGEGARVIIDIPFRVNVTTMRELAV